MKYIFRAWRFIRKVRLNRLMITHLLPQYWQVVLTILCVMLNAQTKTSISQREWTGGHRMVVGHHFICHSAFIKSR
jgi:hypothetical protein